MARPSEIETKTVSVRLPMASYIRVLQEAVGRNLSLSEYLTLKIMGGDPPAQVALPVLQPVLAETAEPVTVPVATLDSIPGERPAVTLKKKKKVVAKKKADPTPAVVLPVAVPKAKKKAQTAPVQVSKAKPTSPVAAQPAKQPTETVQSVAEQRKKLKKELATINRRISTYRQHSNEDKANEWLPRQAELVNQLAAIKGKRK